MPGYAGTGQAQLIRENQQIFLFQRENGVTGKASIALQLERLRNLYPFGVSFQIYFTDVNGNPANPGAFEVDIQGSDLDEDEQYSKAEALVTGLNANFVGRLEFPTFPARYTRAFVTTLTNSVFVNLLATH
jgi:hypothetical protein